MAFWLDIAAFLVKALIIVAAVGGLALLIARLARSTEPKDQDIKILSLDERYEDMRDAMNGALLDRRELKALAKRRKKEAKAAAKARRISGSVRAAGLLRVAQASAARSARGARIDDVFP